MMTRFKLIRVYVLLLALTLLTLANACKKDVKVPELFTTQLSAITQTGAICGGYIMGDDDKNAEITQRGVCWSTHQTPTLSDSYSLDGTGSGSYTSVITGLSANTTYYVRAYAVNSAGTSYGNIISFTTEPLLTDFDGNVYNTVKIGSQVWMMQNLKVTHYRDGSTIPNISSNSAWSNLTTDAYCNYNNDLSTADIYGKLYNWYAVHDSRYLAPAGWHVASYAEWSALIDFLGEASNAGNRLKEAGLVHWLTPNTGATNESGFAALPGGARNTGGVYFGITTNGFWWTSTEVLVNWGGYASLSYNSSSTYQNISESKNGYSVRCVKD